MGVNLMILIGHLGADPELKTIGDKTVCNFSIATNETWNDKNGEKQERVEWTDIQAWGKLGENCAKYLKKGREVYVEGRKQTRSWEDKDSGKKMYKTECVASQVQFLGGGDKRDNSEPRGGRSDEF